MSSTQRVEFINAIIHKFMNSHSTLLASELQKAKYQYFLANLPFSIASSSAIRIFSKLVENLRSILTDEVNDSDISVCLEDCTDKCQIVLKSLISGVSFTNVIEIWEVKHMAVNTTSIYGECAALGRKLASLASEFNLTYIAATLQGLIQEVELSNTNPVNKQDQDMIRNPLQVNAKGRPAKRLKSSGENVLNNSTGNRYINRSGDGYTCHNCLKDAHNL
ncbi:hypothetical protein C1646_815951 [Rhizophagus diaphanus]|nr:hypothetical protein C1646_815951 [Rhizophagus diaphanus] [Rhizophagus sp. MUCL 43196]